MHTQAQCTENPGSENADRYLSAPQHGHLVILEDPSDVHVYSENRFRSSLSMTRQCLVLFWRRVIRLVLTDLLWNVDFPHVAPKLVFGWHRVINILVTSLCIW